MAVGSFDNPISGVNNELVINWLQSQNFSTLLKTGWQVTKNGAATFYSLTVQGGTIVIEGASGAIFIYSGTPALGNLIGSWAGSAGTDSFGNAYPQGINVTTGSILGPVIAANTITAGQIAAGTLTGIYTGAAYFGQNMVQDPAFTSTLLNAVRTGDPATNATWTLSGGTAAVTAGTPAKRLALMPSVQPDFFVTPGEQFFLSITGTVTGSCQIGIELVFNNGSINTVSATNTGTFTASGTVTVPAGAQYGYARIFAFASSGSPTATLSNPAVYIGSLFSPTITGTDYIINTSGAFFYSGTPALGNLIASVTAASGTDGFGNTYLAGVTTYNLNGSDTYAVTISTPVSSSPSVQFENLTHTSAVGYPGIHGNAFSGSGQFDQLIMSSGGQTGDTVASVSLQSKNAGGGSKPIVAVLSSVLEVTGGAIIGTGGGSIIYGDTSWHTPGSLPTGWTGTAQYRLLPDGTVIVVVQCAIGTTSPTGTITLFSGQDANHTASVTTRGPCGYFVNGTPATIAALTAINNMRWTATTSGSITVNAFPGGGAGTGVTEIDFVAVYPALI